MSNTKTGDIGWGILGCGDVTEVKSGPALHKAPRSRVVQVMRRDGAKAADYAQRHDVPSWTDEADVLLSNGDINAVYIATPPATHAQYAISAMRAGKDVLVEKPMALNVAECQAMIAVQQETGRKLVVAYYRRALPRFERMRALVQGGDIGTPRLVEVRQFIHGDFRPGQAWKVESAEAGGLFADMQTHALDWLTYVFGAPHSVQGLAKRQAGAYAAVDLVSYVMDFGALPAVGLFSYAAAQREESLTVHGSAGSVSMGFFRPSPITLTVGERVETLDLPDPAHVHQPFVERVLAHLLDGAPNPCAADEAIRTNAAMAQIYEGPAGVAKPD